MILELLKTAVMTKVHCFYFRNTLMSINCG